jgi:FG-GAP repeat
MFVMLSNLHYTLHSSSRVVAFILGIVVILPGFPGAVSAETIDIRDGVRTLVYANSVGVAVNALGWAMAFGDIDGDGYTDFLCSNNSGARLNAHVIFGRPRAEMDSVYAMGGPGDADIWEMSL